MRRNAWQSIIVIFVILLVVGGALKALAEETPSLVFVTEYIRELKVNENARANAEREFNASKSPRQDLFTHTP